jgi:translation initiation factor IF-2
MPEQTENIIQRPPIVVIMGHIDHGKSALLDYIRKSNVVEHEAGGITQHISAYEVAHRDQVGQERRITFLDTPGHEAFQTMRSRGARVADIAVLIVSAEEGVKAQTLEALAAIRESGIPFIVAINKIDKPAADVERTKSSLLENEIYLEGLGGDVPWVSISAKSGQGVPELLDLMLLVADLEELTGNPDVPAEGVVVESNLDPKKGVAATLIVRNGSIRTGMSVVAGESLAPVRLMEDFLGKPIKEATFSSPIRIIGFNSLPPVGATFHTFGKKKDAEAAIADFKANRVASKTEIADQLEEEGRTVIPVVLKADVQGSIDAIEHELSKFESERTHIRIIHKGVGAISEGDVKLALGASQPVIVGFNIGIEPVAKDVADRAGIAIQTFNIIYRLSEWFADVATARTPKLSVEETSGKARVLKVFSKTKKGLVLGGKVSEGELALKAQVKILRKGEEVGRGTIKNLQQNKADSKHVRTGDEFGAELETSVEILGGDELEGFIVIEK